MLNSFYSIRSTLEPLQRVPHIHFRSCELLQAATCSTGEAEREQRAARSALPAAREGEGRKLGNKQRRQRWRVQTPGARESEDGREARGESVNDRRCGRGTK